MIAQQPPASKKNTTLAEPKANTTTSLKKQPTKVNPTLAKAKLKPAAKVLKKAAPARKPVALAAKKATQKQAVKKSVKKVSHPGSSNSTTLAKKKKKQHPADNARVMTEVDSQVEVDAKLQTKLA